MHDPKTIERFIELRAQGWSYARLVTELNVTKPTLIAWSRKYQFQLRNLKAIELEALGEKWLNSIHGRVNRLGEQLQEVETELAKRNVSDLTTAQLHSFAQNLRKQIAQATDVSTFATPVRELPEDEYFDQVHHWQA